jgi:5-methylcytosine-specific restriction endonuclease McrA
MQKHTKIYLEFYGFDESSWIACQVCLARAAVDIHHITPRSQWGSKRKGDQDSIVNLIALCRDCHDRAHGGYLKRDKLMNIVKKSIHIRLDTNPQETHSKPLLI